MTAALANPFRRGSQGWGMLDQQNHAAEGANRSIMVEMFVCLCLASKKPSEQDFFVPARTDLSVKLLTHCAPKKPNGSKSAFTMLGACSKQGKGTSTSSANAAGQSRYASIHKTNSLHTHHCRPHY